MRRTFARAALALLVGMAASLSAQMPDVRQMSGIPIPMNDTPAGTVVVRVVRGDLGNDVPGLAVELHIGNEVRRATTDDTGRATFSDLPVGATVHAVADVDQERLESQSFAVPPDAGIRVLLAGGVGGRAPESSAAAPALPTGAPIPAGEVAFGGESRIHIEFDDDKPEVFYLLDLVNPGRTAVTPTRALVFELPPDAQAPSPLEGSSTQMTLRGRTVTISGPIQPGTTPIQLAYSLPAGAATRTLRQSFPVLWSPVQVVVMQMGTVQLRSSQFSSVNSMPGEQHAFVFGQGASLAADTPLTVELSGLPSRTRYGRNLTLLVALVVIGAGVWASRRSGGQSAQQLRRAQLEARRGRLMADLVKLERQRASGGNRVRQAERREALVAQLERIYGELDQQPTPGGDRSSQP